MKGIRGHGCGWHGRPRHLGSLLTLLGAIALLLSASAVAAVAHGGGWSAPKPIDHGTGLTSVSCASSKFCVAVDGNGDAVTYAHGKWGSPKKIDSDGLTSVSCPSSRFCIAVDMNGRAVAYTKGHWGSPDAIDSGGGGLRSVSCGSTTFCAAVDATYHAILYKKGHWGKPKAIDSSKNGKDGLNAVSCAGSFCAAVDQHDGMTYNGHSWSKPHVVDPKGGFLESISCISKKFCMEVDSEGDAHEYLRGTWGPPRGPYAGHHFASISCVTTKFCIAVGNHVEVRYYGSPLWRKPKTIDKKAPLSAISCSSTKRCVVVDTKGNVVTYH